ncbi:hypothetical protein QCM80_45800 [Bradyrhizobium sp. SSUT112]|uniref:hypothetical protein n=1 Tax=Bradyrhizobium sp. SSUT112 TaxID=3040604 RepID=UPI00244AA678|nr:hypothetical protein [Bradyrhizobium sp. SSUT112]MDH2357765.1 hypothetical protein [Bradyrhizobium sp. SSUT112]
MINDHLVKPTLTTRIRKIGIVETAVLLLGTMTAFPVLGEGSRISECFERFEKSAIERVSESFEDIKGIAPVSDELMTALASLTQSVQGAQKPPVQAKGQ